MAVKPVVGPPNPFPAAFPTDVLPAGTALHRVHAKAWSANTANPSSRTQYRFSPIFDADNRLVPTLYAGATQPCAFMETVFRGVADGGVQQSIRASKLKDRVYSELRTERALRLARLDGVGLAFFRIEQQQVTATSSEFYAITARWCEAFYRTDPTLDGLLWVSHRATPARAYLFFGPSVQPKDLAIVQGPAALLSDPPTWRALKDTATQIRVRIPEFGGMPS